VPPPAQPSLDSVSTIRDDGSRRYLFPADVSGRFTRARAGAALVLIAIYLLLPWIKVGGYPAVFLDVAERRFHFFGWTLAAQDLWLMFFLITGLGFSLFFVTALLGRVWCGWACPQTVFLDHVYRKIERWIDGDAVGRRALDAAPWTTAKIGRRIAKHAAYLVVSGAIAHLFLAYFVSIPALWRMMSAAPVEHWSAFAFMAVFTGGLYFNFAWFREQLCIVICPYGRLQSVLIDDNSLVIGYDARRGEPRGKLHHETCGAEGANQVLSERLTGDMGGTPMPRGTGVPPVGLRARAKPDLRSGTEAPNPAATGTAAYGDAALQRPGDCIACNRCVQVCPTGIDIRQGLQIECIGCAACIDACDEVMTRIHKPRGLVRYDSLNGLAGRATRWFRPRVALYGVLLAVGAAVATRALSTVKPAYFSVTRMTGMPYVVTPDAIRNQFFVRLVNTRAVATAFVVTTANAAGARQAGFDTPVTVSPLGEEVRPLMLVQSRAAYTGSFRFTVVARDVAGTFELKREVEFLGPDARLLQEDVLEKKLHQ
jgi:polyferredoxin